MPAETDPQPSAPYHLKTDVPACPQNGAASLSARGGQSGHDQGRSLTDSEFEQLYRSQWSPVVNYLRLRLGEDGRDIAAELFVRAWQRRNQYDPRRGTAEAWLWGIVRNAHADHLRRRNPVEPLPRSMRSEVDWEARAQDRLRVELVLDGLQELSSGDQEIVALRFGAGLTNGEVADMLQITENNVRVRVHRAIRRLREILETGRPE